VKFTRDQVAEAITVGGSMKGAAALLGCGPTMIRHYVDVYPDLKSMVRLRPGSKAITEHQKAYRASAKGRVNGNRHSTRWKISNWWKVAAHNAVKVAKQAGVMISQPCEVCGEKSAGAHHDDYGKPLSVRWLCRIHHRQWHRENGPGKAPEVMPDKDHSSWKKKAALKKRGGTSRFKGVRLDDGRWRAKIEKGPVVYNLGTFKDELSAALAYDAKARELFGRYAALNVPREGEKSCLVLTKETV
jgi:hypothetical protein